MKITNFDKSILILLIIYKHSSLECPITSLEIKDWFMKEYQSSIDIRTIENVILSFNKIQDEYEIEIIKSKPNKYYFSSTPGLDIGEAKAIIDLIYSSHFFTETTKENFILQMKSLFNHSDAEILNKVLPTHICRNEDSKSFYESFERIAKAIHRQEKITFNYVKPGYMPNRSANLKKKFCPIETVCENNTFYLYCYDEISGKERNYRIDYIHDVILTGEYFIPNIKIIRKFTNDIIDSTAAFGPQRYATLTLKFENSIYANIIDKFGHHIKREIQIFDDDHYMVCIEKCPLSATFYGWIIGFEGKIQIISPDEEVQKFKLFLLNHFIH